MRFKKLENFIWALVIVFMMTTVAYALIKDRNIDSAANIATSKIASPWSAIVVSGGTIDNATIGATTPETGVFTTLQATTHILYLSEIVNCDTDTTVLAANSGALYTNKGATAATIWTLPTASAGQVFLFSSVASDTTLDITITAASGDKINGGNAAGSYAAASTEEKRACTIIAVDDTDWRVISEVGTWSN